MTRVTLTVDVRGVSEGFLPLGDITPLVNLWQDFEPQLYGYALNAHDALELEAFDGEHRPLGTVAVTVAHPSRTVISPETEFEIVSVLERPRVASAYRCATCERAGQTSYGPFTCQACPQDHARVCDFHVQLLPGSLEGTCPLHAARCDCGQPGGAYCTGPGCRGRKAWCTNHLRYRGSSPYCAVCHAQKFPPCSTSGCEAVGSLACQHVQGTGAACGRRVCPRHAHTWQVFGPSRPGLMRCPRHADVLQQGPDEMVFQVLANSALHEKVGVPRIAGFRYILAKPGLINPTVPEAYDYVLRAPRMAPALREQLEQIIRRQRERWDREVKEGSARLEDAVTRLRAWMQRAGTVNALSTLQGVGWVPGRDGRRDLLLIQVDPRHFPQAVRLKAEQDLGFSLKVKGQG